MPDPNVLEKINLDNTEYLIKDGATETLTVAEITTGTDTESKFVTAKVIHDYIASLDATNTLY